MIKFVLKENVTLEEIKNANPTHNEHECKACWAAHKCAFQDRKNGEFLDETLETTICRMNTIFQDDSFYLEEYLAKIA